MKVRSGIGLVPCFFSLLLASCVDNHSDSRNLVIKEAANYLEPKEEKRLIAVYADVDGRSLILRGDSNGTGARKITLAPGFPLIIDTLIQYSPTEFQSRQFLTRYLVNDSQVVATYYQKIVHPSSNWQGQTPWQETIVTSYPRLDGKSK